MAKVAIVHDWFVGGGAEKVVAEISKLYPEAPIYTAQCSQEWLQKLASAKVITSYMQHWPLFKLRKFLPVLRQHWFSHLDLSDYDLVISSSGAEAKGVQVAMGAVHINYCHAPTHYYWSRYEQYLENPGFGAFNWLARFGLRLLLSPMRHWDYKAAQRPDYLIANSNYIKDQIKKYYGRDAVVVHPPVDLERFASKDSQRLGFVVAGRQTHYKRFDLAVLACSELNLPLTVVGRGPEHIKLVAMAGPSVKFIEIASDDEVVKQLGVAQALIFPGLDDFGITPIEAMAAGTPVIAYQDGGALDYVKPGITGTFFDKQTTESLVTALKAFSANQYSSAEIQKQAQQFSVEAFHRNFTRAVESMIKIPS
jgi:glycosyltransferase involved in cell wall biosynthesis